MIDGTMDAALVCDGNKAGNGQGYLRWLKVAAKNGDDMAIAGNSSKPIVTDPESQSMKVSLYDRVASMLITLLLLVGGTVGCIFFVWLMTVLVFGTTAVPIKLVENAAGRGDHAEGFARDPEAPGMEEMPELAEPQLEAALEAVTDAVSSVAASADVIATASTATSKGKGGLGDSRPPGPLGEGDNLIPRWERWEVKWESKSIAAYATQLDFFKIELGAAGGKPNIDYAFNLSKGRPDTRTGPSKDEKRIYMSWRGNTPLKAFDQTLLTRAGIAYQGRLMVQFYPEEVEDRLAWIEMENAKSLGHSSVKEFLRTVFGVRPQGRGYEFFVQDQRFRPAPP